GQESPGGEVRAGRGSVPGGCVFHARCTAAPTRRVKRGGAKGPNLGPRDEIRPRAAPPAMESRAPVCQNRFETNRRAPMTPANPRLAAGFYSSARPFAPLLFFPAGIAYCIIYDLTIVGGLIPFGELLNWSLLTLSPWVVGALIFERA